MSQFAGCMTITNFNTANMANAWGNLQAKNGSECKRCHATGGEGFIASTNAQVMFDTISTNKMLLPPVLHGRPHHGRHGRQGRR